MPDDVELVWRLDRAAETPARNGAQGSARHPEAPHGKSLDRRRRPFAGADAPDGADFVGDLRGRADLARATAAAAAGAAPAGSGDDFRPDRFLLRGQGGHRQTARGSHAQAGALLPDCDAAQ
ncbi:hypothetical protein SDC9_104934 [bioreactor metagenome]|uniref:Uncharacterized protein n=1 Tax=bioreactor metagenome TaxID=1076179 RepID=A0A645AXY3_9ZZZZ